LRPIRPPTPSFPRTLFVSRVASKPLEEPALLAAIESEPPGASALGLSNGRSGFAL